MADSDPRILRLVQEVLDSGRTPGDVCAAHPDVLRQVRERVARCRGVEADGITYGVPLYQAPEPDRSIVDLIRCAFTDRTRVDLETRRSAFWRMDGSLDEIAAVITGVRLG